MRATDHELIADFRARCSERGLAVTHQRTVIYKALMDSRHHPSPEEVYRRVRRQIPSISLGTVYKNIRIFIDHGLLREASPHHGCARLEINLEPHHHLVCLRCRAIVDLDDEAVEPVRLKSRPPAGFRVERCLVEVLGVCEKCSRRK
ncbi:MAG TPA: transcriptional repressor [Bryobacteraceae bacterium]|nr:transcriptional repressor [Bryobacteraceae bacterium]